MYDITSTIRRTALAPNRRNLDHGQLRLPDKDRANKGVGCLLCSMASINDLWDGSLDKRKVRGLVPCCGQNGYRSS